MNLKLNFNLKLEVAFTMQKIGVKIPKSELFTENNNDVNLIEKG